ncbi:energy-coupling factor transport system permease/ATP-binding protein [Microdochium nivale]|nr:energy-coupling factor transport system permease/ATP-binding protein [Microdochium nivale]
MVQHHWLHGHHDGPSQHVGPKTQKFELAGRIMWLPSKTVDLGFTDNIYNHPVVVLSPQHTHGKVDFFSMTSFGETNIRSKTYDRRQHYLPVAPNDPHPDNNKLLQLSNALDRLNKETYVKISSVYTTDLSNLRDYRRQRPFHLSQKSYQQLLSWSSYTVKIVESQSKVTTITQPKENLHSPVSRPPIISQAGHPWAQSSLDNLRNEAFRQTTLPRYGQRITSPSTTQPPSPLYSQSRQSPPPPPPYTDYPSHLSLLELLGLANLPPPSAPLPSPHRPQPSPLRTTTSERTPLLANSTRQPRSLSQPHYDFYSTNAVYHYVRGGQATNNLTYGSSQRPSTRLSRLSFWVTVFLVLLGIAAFLGLLYGLYLAALAVIAAALSVWSWVVQTWDAVVAVVVGVATAVGEAPGRVWNWILTELAEMARAMPWNG